MNRKLRCAAFAALAVAFTAAYAAEDRVVLYSSNNVDTLKAITDGFNAQYPDIQVSTVRAGTGSTMKRIKAEAKNPMGDIFWSGGLSTINQFTAYQEAYKNKETEAVAADLRDPNGFWLATNMHIAVLMVNTKAMPAGAKVPKTWADLADPVWKGNIVSPDPAR
ncbi:MAG: extracellular solute-binding protein, partial [Duodenibacillus sp.]|nr:extracellular solute-binding protein [Duodenibacillus sp.]